MKFNLKQNKELVKDNKNFDNFIEEMTKNVKDLIRTTDFI